MRHVLRVGLLVSALLTAPLATAATSSALPLEPRSSAVERQAPESVGLVCTMQYPPTPLCWLSSLSASGPQA
ncbi:hypothetical protein [Nocardia sp. NBC_01329]|uniref:hypothetical protein n=1 Tax=Nocardia sp. NBC_01329 TaxID=2903594 RepID=UPI002E115A9B|nr:hypothetical protein OG405_03820 [Nocardia sp. NBC_01329]